MGSGHMVHAVVRLWGKLLTMLHHLRRPCWHMLTAALLVSACLPPAALTLAQGWLVWRTRRVVDAHVRKTFCQAYCVCFTLQTLALIRAHATSPDQHSILNLFSIFLFAVQASVYGYFIFFEKLNAFESLDKALG